jgi:hypothetical protein
MHYFKPTTLTKYTPGRSVRGSVEQFEALLFACIALDRKLIHRVVTQIAKAINRLHIQENQNVNMFLRLVRSTLRL